MAVAVFDVNILKHVLDPVGGDRRIREIFYSAISKCWKLVWHESRFKKHYIKALRSNGERWARLKDMLQGSQNHKMVIVRTSQIEAKPLKEYEKKAIAQWDKKDELLFAAARATGEEIAVIVSNEGRLKRVTDVTGIRVIDSDDLAMELEKESTQP